MTNHDAYRTSCVLARCRSWLLISPVVAIAACGGDHAPQTHEERSGGALTVFDTTRDAFGRPAPSLDAERLSHFFVGNTFFTENWVTAPSSTRTHDGLGPTFNARSCASCHFKDGRGRPPRDDEPMIQLLVRLSVPGTGEHGGPKPEPHYGRQFNPQAIEGVPAEGQASLRWEEQQGTYADGTSYTLRRPIVEFDDLAFGPLASDLMTSPRVAPGVYGLGLIEAIPEATVLALADEDDADGDGISGRPNRVWDLTEQRTVLGRFGWKANQSTLEQQSAGAFVGDIGITSPLFTDENCPQTQSACAKAQNGGRPEIDEKLLGRVAFYVRTLAVPARRDWQDAEVLHGKQLFSEARCDACHVSQLRTGRVPGTPELSEQPIHPYTDLLLHDMGDGLADGRPDFLATGREWRTPPLWGIGMVRYVNRHTNFLHDGRARNLTEAVLWHGGEAEASRRRFEAFSAAQRQDLVRFLESL